MFDVIVSFETIEHVDNGEKVFSEFNRVLKDNGLLIISTPNKNISIQNNINNPFHGTWNCCLYKGFSGVTTSN